MDDDDEAASPSLRAARASHRAQSEGNVFPSYLETHSSELLSDGSADHATPVAELVGEGCQSAEGEDACIADWVHALEVGGLLASAAIADIANQARALAFDPIGCHVVQRALEVANPAEAYHLASGLHGSVVDAARSPYAHLVLEEIVHRLGTNDATFIAEEMMLGCVRSVALNIYGYKVVCRMLEFSAREHAVSALVDEVLAQDIAALCCHKFGHRVAMSIISNGSQGHRSRIIASLREGGLQRLARHRFASRVLEQALTQSSSAEAHALAAELMAQAGAVVSLACHSFGMHVVRGLLQLPQESSKIALQYLQRAVRKLRKDKYAVALVDELGLQDPEDRVARNLAVGGA
eukprot:CAMPEP_0115233350 /NCGR_PEP_ID=MMETSP0270-20121206/34231_1 /TAXON_ID=71861 /ORGANISM="Scrippsiella trochoidea, Strain CCMP3099" /LENGTH=350 /DNA_ID=CAMNT_0002648061 /DNA_START=122 /DNA_END=1174 /DNA_ORIENTATION=-